MKKTSKILAILMALVVVLCACGESKTEEVSEETSSVYNFSDKIAANGYWEGVTATDYVTLCDLGSIDIQETDIDYEIAYIMSQADYMISSQDYDSAVENYDYVNIDYVGSIDGVEFDGGNTEGAGTTVQIGVTSYIDDFLEQIIGRKPGETFDVEVTFPEDYGVDELNGKDAVFKTTVNYIVTYEVADLTDDYVNEYLSGDFGVTTIQELRDMIKISLVFNEIIDASTFAEELPEVIKDQYLESIEYQITIQADSYGMTADDFVSAYYSSYGITDLVTLISAYESYAASVQQEDIVLQAISETQNIVVTEEDMEQFYKEFGEDYSASGLEFDKDTFIDTYGEPYLTKQVLYDKVDEFLLSL